MSEHHSAAPTLPTEGLKDLHFYFVFVEVPMNLFAFPLTILWVVPDAFGRILDC